MDQYLPRLDRSFAALSDRTRRGILERLGRGDASITDLATAFDMSLTGIKKHVRLLEEVGLVTTEKVGRVRHCRLGPRRLEDETAWIMQYRQMLEARLDRLGEYLERTEGDRFVSTPLNQPGSPSTDVTEEARIRERLEAWARAVRRHDLDGVVAHHAEDVVYFDVPPPTQVRGIRGYKDSWPPFFAYIGETGGFDLDELSINAGPDVAFAHAVLRVRGESELRPASVRLTVGLRKIGGEWTIVHEHHSAPYDAAS